MIINGKALLAARPIVEMQPLKLKSSGPTTYGLSEAGYDIRVAQDVSFYRDWLGRRWVKVADHRPILTLKGNVIKPTEEKRGTFAIASAIEEFTMPENLMGVVHDKSTWARQGLSVYNTVIEPGWNGFLTLELEYQGQDDLFIPTGSGIAQVIFHKTWEPAEYNGRYQNQEDRPVPALNAT